jgi:transcriptional regulator with XRE-family HTH domain
MTPDEVFIEDVAVRVRQAITQHKLTQNEVTEQSGVSTSVLSQWLQRKYRGDSKGIANRLAVWLRDVALLGPEALRQRARGGGVSESTPRRMSTPDFRLASAVPSL